MSYHPIRGSLVMMTMKRQRPLSKAPLMSSRLVKFEKPLKRADKNWGLRWVLPRLVRHHRVHRALSFQLPQPLLRQTTISLNQISLRFKNSASHATKLFWSYVMLMAIRLRQWPHSLQNRLNFSFKSRFSISEFS